MNDRKIQARVDRIFAGHRNPRDIEILFTWLRFRSYGNDVVRDIGDFIAHLEERDRGAAFDAIGGFCSTLEFMIPRIVDKRGDAYPPCTKEILCKHINHSIIRFTEAEIFSKIGMQKSVALKFAKSLSKKISSFDGNDIHFHNDLNKREGKILEFFTSVIIVRPTYADGIIIEQMIGALEKNKFLVPKNISEHHKQFILACIMEKIHNSIVKSQIGNAILEMKVGNDGLIGVCATVPSPLGDGKSIGWPFMETNCKADDWIEAGSIDAFGNFPEGEPIELNSSGKFDVVRMPST